MSNFSFWVRWLVVVGWVLVAFGLTMAFLNQTLAFNMAFNQWVDPAFWPDGSIPAELQPFQAWAYGLVGATVAGWGVFVLFIVNNPFKNRERWAWTCMMAGITLWFFVDTGLSAYFGVTFNVFFNLAVALLFYVPLAATRSEFK